MAIDRNKSSGSSLKYKQLKGKLKKAIEAENWIIGIFKFNIFLKINLYKKALIILIINAIIASFGKRRIVTPIEGEIPPPPLNLKKIGQLWPAITAIPPNTKILVSKPNKIPIKIIRKDFKVSKAPTKIPAKNPS